MKKQCNDYDRTSASSLPYRSLCFCCRDLGNGPDLGPPGLQWAVAGTEASNEQPSEAPELDLLLRPKVKGSRLVPVIGYLLPRISKFAWHNRAQTDYPVLCCHHENGQDGEVCSLRLIRACN